MGVVAGRCRKCGKLMLSPHQSGLCKKCRKTFHDHPDDMPGPLRINRDYLNK